MSAAADLGCAIVPPMLTFYNGADTLDAQIDNVIGRVLMQIGITYKEFHPWTGKKVRKSQYEEMSLFD